MLGTKLYIHKMLVGLVCMALAFVIVLLFDKSSFSSFAVNQCDLYLAIAYLN